MKQGSLSTSEVLSDNHKIDFLFSTIFFKNTIDFLY